MLDTLLFLSGRYCKVTPMNKDEVLRKYAAEGERIYNDRTAGDNTWLGFLVSFAMEFEVADDE